MKSILVFALFSAAGCANAFCPAPMQTGNRNIDVQNQQMFYQCLNNEQRQLQHPVYPQQQRNTGAINFGLLDTQAPERAANAYEEGRRQKLQNELLELQIQQLKKQQGQ